MKSPPSAKNPIRIRQQVVYLLQDPKSMSNPHEIISKAQSYPCMFSTCGLHIHGRFMWTPWFTNFPETYCLGPSMSRVIGFSRPPALLPVCTFLMTRLRTTGLHLQRTSLYKSLKNLLVLGCLRAFQKTYQAPQESTCLGLARLALSAWLTSLRHRRSANIHASHDPTSCTSFGPEDELGTFRLFNSSTSLMVATLGGFLTQVSPTNLSSAAMLPQNGQREGQNETNKDFN